MRITRLVPVLTAFAVLELSALGAAQSPPPDPGRPARAAAKEGRDKAKELRDKAHDAAKELRDKAEEHREEAKEKREQRRDAAKEEREEGRETAEQRSEKRKQRRRAHVEELRSRWGDSLAQPAVRAELKVHARRIARLNQLRKLAEQEHKDKLIERIDKLIEKENARHQKHMDTLKSHAAEKEGDK